MLQKVEQVAGLAAGGAEVDIGYPQGAVVAGRRCGSSGRTRNRCGSLGRCPESGGRWLLCVARLTRTKQSGDTIQHAIIKPSPYDDGVAIE